MEERGLKIHRYLARPSSQKQEALFGITKQCNFSTSSIKAVPTLLMSDVDEEFEAVFSYRISIRKKVYFLPRVTHR